MMKTSKKLFTALTALMVVFAMSATVFAAALTKEQAADKALADAGLSASQVTRLVAERDDGNYEISFVRTDNGAEYEYEISRRNGRIRDVSVDYVYQKNYSNKKISKAKAIKAVSKASGIKSSTIKSGTCRLKKDDREWVYKIRFDSGKYSWSYEVQAATGTITEFDKEYKGR